MPGEPEMEPTRKQYKSGLLDTPQAGCSTRQRGMQGDKQRFVIQSFYGKFAAIKTVRFQILGKLGSCKNALILSKIGRHVGFFT